MVVISAISHISISMIPLNNFSTCFQKCSIYLGVFYIKLAGFSTFLSSNADNYVKKSVIIFQHSSIKIVKKMQFTANIYTIFTFADRERYIPCLPRIMNLTIIMVVLFFIF